MRPKVSVSLLLGLLAVFPFQNCSGPGSKSPAIRVRWAHDPEALDPLQLPNQIATDAADLLHLSLLQADLSTGKVAPALAETLPVAELVGDSLTRLTYRLRSAATWDDGRPVLAADVAFTLKLMYCPGLPNERSRLAYGFIRAFFPDPQDPRRFTLQCQGQAVEYLKTSGDFFILPEAALDPAGQLRRFSLADMQHRSPVAPADSAVAAVARRYRALAPGKLPGCGPYRLTTWEKDQYLRFSRKAPWWPDGLRPGPFVLRARSKQLDFVIIPDAATASLALQRGDLDVLPQVPAREFARLRASATARAALNFYTASSFDVVYAGFNTNRPALADALTRRALSHCFDAAGLLQATQLGQGQLTAGLVQPLDRVNYNEALAPVAFAPAQTAALLRQAGWQRTSGAAGGWARPGPDGQPQQLRLVVRYRAAESTFATVALQFQAAAAGLGIPVVLLPTESGTFTRALQRGDFDVYVRTLHGNPFMFNFVPLLHSRAIGRGNTSGYGTAASDRLIEAIAGARSLAQRARLLRQFQALMQAEAPWVPLFFLPTRIAAGRRLTGLHVTALKPGFAVTAIERAAAPAPTPRPR